MQVLVKDGLGETRQGVGLFVFTRQTQRQGRSTFLSSNCSPRAAHSIVRSLGGEGAGAV